jgi:hypothetical protein
MPSVTIDATVLAVPEAGATLAEARRYVENLLDWRQLLSERWISLHVCEQTAHTLTDAGLYPLRDHLRRLFAATGVEEYDVNTVAQTAERLMALTPTFEDTSGLREVLYENVTLTPNLADDCTSPALAEALRRSALLIAVLRCNVTPPVLDHPLVARLAPGPTQVQVQAHVHAIEHTRDDLTDCPTPPDYFSGEVIVCRDFRELLTNVDEGTLWDSDDPIESEHERLQASLRIHVYKLRLMAGLDPDWSDELRLRFGAAFRARERSVLKGTTASMRDKVLRAIVETHEHLKDTDVHALRASNSGGAPQRVRRRDGAKAWRRDIDRDHHLHYWVCTDGIIEIAWLSYPHDDFNCPE